MDTQQHLPGFLDFLRRVPGAKPIAHFRARGGRRAKPPVFNYTMPRGDVFHFDEHFLFLTKTTKLPGASLFFGEFAH